MATVKTQVHYDLEMNIQFLSIAWNKTNVLCLLLLLLGIFDTLSILEACKNYITFNHLIILAFKLFLKLSLNHITFYTFFTLKLNKIIRSWNSIVGYKWSWTYFTKMIYVYICSNFGILGILIFILIFEYSY